jgi:hypothetical protein
MSQREGEPGVRTSRRQALQLLLGTLAGALAGTALVGILPGRAQGKRKPDARGVLKLPISNLFLQYAPIAAILQKLQLEFNVPISFIQAPEDNPTTVHVENGTVADVLKQILDQNPTYVLREMSGCQVLLPKGSRYEKIIDGVSIKNKPRAEASSAYMELLKKHKGFEDMLGVATAHSGVNMRILTDPVTLSRKASVGQHLVELLGKDDTLLFALQKAGGAGGYLLWIGNVLKTQPAHPPKP